MTRARAEGDVKAGLLESREIRDCESGAVILDEHPGTVKGPAG